MSEFFKAEDFADIEQTDHFGREVYLQERACRTIAHVANTKIAPLQAEVERLRAEVATCKGGLQVAEAELAALKKEAARMLPIAEAAFWDHHTAGTLPGAGYNNRAEHLAGLEWGWRESKTFRKWREELRARFGLEPKGES